MEALKRPIAPADIIVFDTLESTNQTAKELAQKGAKHGTVILSEEQTRGRGRFGRSFYSPAMNGIYMSLILKPDQAALQTHLVTAAAAVAAVNAIESVTGIAAEIKWVNDILVDGRKVCGILAETAGVGQIGHCIILGIGINFCMRREDFSSGLQDTAAALFEEKPDAISREELAAAVIGNILEMGTSPRFGDCLPEYKRRSAVLGRDIWITGAGGAFKGRAVDIDENGCLVVANGAGGTAKLNAGEVSIRRCND